MLLDIAFSLAYKVHSLAVHEDHVRQCVTQNTVDE